MYPVQGGTQKITFGSPKMRKQDDSEYQSKLAAAKAQSDASNEYMWGAQSVMYDIAEDGIGAAAAASRSPQYGNPNVMANRLVNGNVANTMAGSDAAGNQYLENPMNQTGYLAGQASSTISPQEDPQVMGENAAMRVAMLQEGIQYGGLNDRRQLYGA